MADDLAMLAAGLPAWCGPEGLPLSWPHYWLGVEHLVRARTREVQRIARAQRMAQNPSSSWERWDRLTELAAE